MKEKSTQEVEEEEACARKANARLKNKIPKGFKTMLELIKEASIPKPDKVPKGFKPVAQWARELGMGLRSCQYAMRQLVDTGKVEEQRFRLPGHTVRTPHYKEK